MMKKKEDTALVPIEQISSSILQLRGLSIISTDFSVALHRDVYAPASMELRDRHQAIPQAPFLEAVFESPPTIAVWIDE